jgi:hypothetical protein
MPLSPFHYAFNSLVIPPPPPNLLQFVIGGICCTLLFYHALCNWISLFFEPLCTFIYFINQHFHSLWRRSLRQIHHVTPPPPPYFTTPSPHQFPLHHPLAPIAALPYLKCVCFSPPGGFERRLVSIPANLIVSIETLNKSRAQNLKQVLKV